MTIHHDVKFQLKPKSEKLELESGERVVAGAAIFLETTQALSMSRGDYFNFIGAALTGGNFDPGAIQQAYHKEIALIGNWEQMDLPPNSLLTVMLADIDTSQDFSDYNDLPSESQNSLFRLLKPNQIYQRQADGSLTSHLSVALGDTVLRDDTAQVGTFGGSEWTWLTPGLASTFMDQKFLIHPNTSGAIADDGAAETFAANQGLGDPNTGGSIYTGPPVTGAWYVRSDGMPRVFNGSVWSNVLKFSLLEGTVPGIAALIGESNTIIGLVKDGEIHLGVKPQAVDAGWLEGKTLAEIQQAFDLQIDAKMEAGKLRRTHRGKVIGKHDFGAGMPADGRHISATDVVAGATVRFSSDGNHAYIFQDSRLVGAYVENDPIAYGELVTWDISAAIPSGATEMIKPSASADLAVAVEISAGLVISFVDGLITELREASDPLELDGLSDWTVGQALPPDGTYSTNTLGATAVVELQPSYKKDWIYIVEGGVATEEAEGVEPADRIIITGDAADEDMGFIYGITTTEQADHGAVGEYNWNPAREQFSSQEHLYVAELTSRGGLITYVSNAVSDFLTETMIKDLIDTETATFVSSDEITNRINIAVKDFLTSDAIDERLVNEIKAAFDSRLHYGTFDPREVKAGVGLDANVGNSYAVTMSPAHFFYSIPNTNITIQFLTHDNGSTWRDMR